MSSLKNSLSYSTLENYKTALRALKQYLKHDISIDRIDKLTLKGFERWLRAKNLCINTTSCYMRSIRALLNKLSVKNKDHVFDGIMQWECHLLMLLSYGARRYVATNWFIIAIRRGSV